MRKRNFVESLSIKISRSQREAIEVLADRKDLSIGEAARELIDAGMIAKGLECY